MLGYVVINRDILTEEEFRIYRGYYCGVCKSIGRRFGQFPRLALSYDIVFLALILSSIEEKEVDIRDEHCIIHPISKNPVAYTEDAIDYGGDMLLILSYYNFLDDRRDEHKVRGAVGTSLLKKTFASLKNKYPEITRGIEVSLEKLSRLEAEKSGSVDLTGQAFGEVLEKVFSGYPPLRERDGERRILGNLGYNLGRWIYLMDALDDMEKDSKSGSYNPFLFRQNGTEGIEEVLFNYLGNVMNSLDLLDIKKNKGIIDNILMMGLRGRTEGLLKKGEE